LEKWALAEGEEDLARAVVDRVIGEEGVEALAGEGFVLVGHGVEAELELGVDDPVLRGRPFRAVRVAVHVLSPHRDGLIVALLVEADLAGAEKRALLLVLEGLGGRDPGLRIGVEDASSAWKVSF